MNPPQIFISHRNEYAQVARDLKKHIQATSQGRIKVFVSADFRDIPGGRDWRQLVEKQLREAESLILIYGAPCEDWSWCFYETGYFAAVDPNSPDRRIYCITRPDVDPPAPLNHLQMVTGTNKLIEELIGIHARHDIDADVANLRSMVEALETRLFGELREFKGYRRVHFMARNADFGPNVEIPADAVFMGDEAMLGDLFKFNATSVRWAEIAAAAHKPCAEQNFMPKWLDETRDIILAARNNEFIAPQTVLIGRGGQRFRTILYRAHNQGHGMYCCEFLAIDEVGGPAVGLSRQNMSLLTSIRMGFRFRSEVIKKFSKDFDCLSEEERSACIKDLPRLIESLELESKAQGDISMEDLLTAFDEDEGERLQKLVGYWPSLKRELYRSLGLAEDGKTSLGEGLRGANVDRFRTAFDAMRLLNTEFLARCCARVPKMMMKTEDDLTPNARKIEQAVRALMQPELKAVA
jgi:TIR domain